ncbi:MAG: hypothetical protein AAGA20_20130 [Planctomycetota bacterium]
MLDDPRAVEMMVRFDETPSDALAELRSDPTAARILDQLDAAERWLRAGLAEADARGEELVPPDELYRFGRGPGAEPLDDERADEIERYLESHADEAEWVEALSSPVPAPLDVTPLTPDEMRIQRLRRIPGAGSHQAPPARRLPAWAALAPLAAAALVLVVAFSGSSTESAQRGLPESPVLRSATSDPLLFPRGQVLAPIDGATTYATRPLFEVLPIDGATRYRFELRAGVDGAFDEGEAVWTSASTEPFASAGPLATGAYAWSAWADVDGVERSLGTRSFSVVKPGASELLRSAAGLASDSHAARADVRRLHEAGYLTDARHRARSLAPGEERSRYLAETR